MVPLSGAWNSQGLLAMGGQAIRLACFSFLLVAVCPLDASAVTFNVLAGYGVVGPGQLDEGSSYPMMTVNVTGFLRAGDHVSFLGIGLANRASNEKNDFDEFGASVPFVTFRRGKLAAQIGVEVQRANFQKNFYYAAVGLAWRGPGRREPPATKAEPVPTTGATPMPMPMSVAARSSRGGGR